MDDVVPVSPVDAVGWAAFDPRVILCDVPPCPTTTAVSKTTNGHEVRVALQFADPPAASYVRLDTDDSVYGLDPMVVAADGDLLLINMTVNADELRAPWWRQSTTNFFVCKVAGPGRPPSLQCLPSLGDDWLCELHTGIVAAARSDHEDDDGFVVADLQLRAADGKFGYGTREFVAKLFRYSSATGRWDLKQLALPAGVDGLGWETDAVFALDGRLMCWADYHQGILFCDVVSAEPPQLRFVRFPGIETRVDFSNGRGPTEDYRTAAVSHGRVWFVDVDDGCFRAASAYPAACTVTTWTLRTPELDAWVKVHELHVNDVWSHWKYRRSPLPRSAVPQFAIVDMEKADVLHFVVRESFADTMHWTITVDLKNWCLLAYAPYRNEVEEPLADVDVRNMFGNRPLVCCKYA